MTLPFDKASSVLVFLESIKRAEVLEIFNQKNEANENKVKTPNKVSQFFSSYRPISINTTYHYLLSK